MLMMSPRFTSRLISSLTVFVPFSIVTLSLPPNVIMTAVSFFIFPFLSEIAAYAFVIVIASVPQKLSNVNLSLFPLNGAYIG